MVKPTRGTQVALAIARQAVEDAIRDLRVAGQAGGKHTAKAIDHLESAIAEIERAITTHEGN